MKDEINYNQIISTFGAMIKQERINRKLTVAELSELSKVSVGVISDLENDRGRVPSLISFLKLVVALDLPSTLFVDMFKETASCDDNNKTKILETALLKYGVSPMALQVVIDVINAHVDNNYFYNHGPKAQRTKFFK